MHGRRWLWLITIVVLVNCLFFIQHWQRIRLFLDDNLEPVPIHVDPSDVVIPEHHLHTLTLHFTSLNGTIPLISMVNVGFLLFTHSWLCNTRNMKGVHERTVLIATDKKAYDELQRDWPHVTTHHLPLEERLSQRHSFGQSGYKAYLLYRVRLLKALIQRGQTFVLFETDAVWLRNPLSYIDSLIMDGETTGHLQYRRILTSDTRTKDNARHVDMWAARLGSPAFYNNNNMSFNFMLVRGREVVGKLWQELDDILSTHLNDTYEQDIIDGLCKDGYGGVICRTFPYNVIADGTWYTEEVRWKEAPQPYVINNNYVQGMGLKVDRAKRFGHWFWDDWRLKCDEQVLEKRKLGSAD